MYRFIKNKKVSKFIHFIGAAFLTLFILLIVLYVWGALNIPRLEGEISFQNSPEYEFSQNPITRYTTIEKDGKNIYTFFFKPQVFAAWVDETRPYVFLITSDTGTLKGAHGLYIYNGNEIKKVYQSRTIEFSAGEKSATSLYSSWVYPDGYKNHFESWIDNKRREMDSRFFNISPDGRYLFGYESGYEGGSGFVIDLPTLTKNDLDFDGSNNLYWSPDKTCAVNYVYGYGYHGLELAYYQGSDLRVVNYTKSFMPDEFTGVYWIDNCIAVVAVKSDIGTTYYKLDKDSDIPLKIIKPNISKLKKGEEFDWPLKNIYFTVKEPSKK